MCEEEGLVLGGFGGWGEVLVVVGGGDFVNILGWGIWILFSCCEELVVVLKLQRYVVRCVIGLGCFWVFVVIVIGWVGAVSFIIVWLGRW